MQISWRRNPKTPDGWFKRVAVALLVGSAAFLVSLPISFFLLLHHFERTTPQDTQNLLGALTASIVIGLTLALLAAVSTLAVSVLYKLVIHRAVPDSSIAMAKPVDRE